MDVDSLSLADPVKSTNSLLKKFRVARKIKENEVVRKLKISTFGSNFRTYEDSCSPGICEPCGIAIPLDKGEIFMELCGFDLNTGEEKRSYGFSELDRFADQNDFLLRDFSKKTSQPIHTGLQELSFTTCGWIKMDKMKLTLREARESFPGIPEHDPASAKTVHQIPRETFSAGSVRVVEIVQKSRRLLRAA